MPSKMMKIHVTARKEIPDLEFDCFCGKPQFNIFANEIITNRECHHYEKLIFHNRKRIAFKVKITLPRPFCLVMDDKIKSTGKFNIKPLESLKVSMYIYRK